MIIKPAAANHNQGRAFGLGFLLLLFCSLSIADTKPPIYKYNFNYCPITITPVSGDASSVSSYASVWQGYDSACASAQNLQSGDYNTMTINPSNSAEILVKRVRDSVIVYRLIPSPSCPSGYVLDALASPPVCITGFGAVGGGGDCPTGQHAENCGTPQQTCVSNPPDGPPEANPDDMDSCDKTPGCPAASNACTSKGGTYFHNSHSCIGLPKNCDGQKDPLPKFANGPAPDFPEPGQPCKKLPDGTMLCSGDATSPDRPPGVPDDQITQGNSNKNDGSPQSGPGSPGNNPEAQSGTGDGTTTDGDYYDDDDGDGYADSKGGNNAGYGPGVGPATCPDCAKEGTLQAIKGDLDGIKDALTPSGAPPTLKKADKINGGSFESDVDQQIETAKQELQAKIATIKAEAQSLLSLQLPSGNAQLPSFYLGNIKGQEITINFAEYSGELSVISSIIILIAILIALWLVFS